MEEKTFDYSNKTEREIFEYLFKRAELRKQVVIQEKQSDCLEVSNWAEDSSIKLIFGLNGKLLTIFGFDGDI